MLKRALLAPRPKASDRTAVAAKPRCFSRLRTPWRMSRSRVYMAVSSPGPVGYYGKRPGSVRRPSVDSRHAAMAGLVRRGAPARREWVSRSRLGQPLLHVNSGPGSDGAGALRDRRLLAGPDLQRRRGQHEPLSGALRRRQALRPCGLRYTICRGRHRGPAIGRLRLARSRRGRAVSRRTRSSADVPGAQTSVPSRRSVAQVVGAAPAARPVRGGVGRGMPRPRIVGRISDSGH